LCSGHHGIRGAGAYRSSGLMAGSVIGIVRTGTEPFTMIEIVSGNS
jgi:hypothetical protein